MFAAKLGQIIPRKQAGGMTIAENNPHGIGAHGFESRHRNVPFTEDKLLLSWAMALYFSAGTFHPQIFGVEVKGFAGVKTNVENSPLLL